MDINKLIERFWKDDIKIPLFISLIGTFIFTTIYEFILKPYIESRKESITRKVERKENIVHYFKLIALSFGSITENEDLFKKIFIANSSFLQDRLSDITANIDNLIFSLGYLDIWEINKHIGNTVKYIAYLKGLIITLNDKLNSINTDSDLNIIYLDLKKIKNHYSYISLFDVYFECYIENNWKCNIFTRKIFLFIYSRCFRKKIDKYFESINLT
jgi:hypothetical protein